MHGMKRVSFIYALASVLLLCCSGCGRSAQEERMFNDIELVKTKMADYVQKVKSGEGGSISGMPLEVERACERLVADGYHTMVSLVVLFPESHLVQYGEKVKGILGDNLVWALTPVVFRERVSDDVDEAYYLTGYFTDQEMVKLVKGLGSHLEHKSAVGSLKGKQ